MTINESIITLFNNMLNGTQVGIYVNKALLMLGGLAGVTVLYFIFMIYYNRKQFKEELKQTKVLEDLYEKIINKNK